MKFSTVAEAFNFYRTKTIDEMQTRAAAIGKEIDTNADADIEALNIELKGIKEAKNNLETRSEIKNNLNIFESSSMKPQKNSFTADTVLDSEEYRSAFFKTLLGQETNETEKRALSVAQTVAEKRADNFNASSDSLAVLPTQTLNEVVKKARTIGGLLGECRAFSVPTKISIPVGTPATKATWHTEGEDVVPDKVGIATVDFDGYEIIKVFSLSAKTRRMSISAFESYLVDELTACVMETIADSLVNGTGVSQGTGLEKGITWGSTNQITAAKTGITYANVVSTVALLKRGYSMGAKWAMNNATLYNVFYGMVDANKRPIFIADPKNETVGKILGFDVVVDDNIADNNVYLGNYSKYLGYNMPEGIAVEVSRESSFRKGLIDYRALAIADTKPIVPEAFVKLTVATGA